MKLFRLALALVLSILAALCAVVGLGGALYGAASLVWNPDLADDVGRVLGGAALMTLTAVLDRLTDLLLDGQ